MKKTFVLGVGAQKAGTTWLYEYLRGHPECAMGHIKEHAVLRAAFSGQRPSGRIETKVAPLIRALTALGDTEEGAMTPEQGSELLALIDNVAGEIDPAYYLGNFQRLMAAAPQARLTGDITPEYCMMDATALKAVRAAIEGAGYNLKVVFLMREPLVRIYSSLRMAERNRKDKGLTVGRPAVERFKLQYAAAWVEQRTRYEVMLEALDTAFDPAHVYVGFYETFFSQESLAQLLDFLGLSHHPANFSHMANASPKGDDLAAEDIAAAREYYDATYRNCAARFGEGFIADIWQHY